MCGSPVLKSKIILLCISIASLRSKHHITELACSYALQKLVKYSPIYEALMNSALNESSAVRCLKCSNAIEICNRIIFTLYHMCINVCFITNLVNSTILEYNCLRVCNDPARSCWNVNVCIAVVSVCCLGS